jgi:GNAT superfamily N-acetyltransferase
MPITTDPSASPMGRLLVDREGRVLARFQDDARDGMRWADLFELADGTSPAQVVAAVLADLPGALVSGSEAVGLALVAAGARRRRHAHVFSRDLHADPPPPWRPVGIPDGVRITPLDRPAADLVDAWRAAFPAGHPDHLGGPPPAHVEEELTDQIAGRTLGPLLPCSGLAVSGDHRVVAGIIVTDRHGTPPWGGPWVGDLFRHPDRRWAGLGRLLLERALGIAAELGLPALGLAVTEGNPARRLYESLSFRPVLTSLTVEVPLAPP